jgi:RNA polymerase sigma factor (sigma-70 family)
MTTQRASQLLSENLTAIYGYAFGKLYDKSDVDDLAGEIVCRVLSAVERLEKEEAFWGFVWRIAENTFCDYIKKKKQSPIPAEELPTAEVSPSAEDAYLSAVEETDALYRLRRELALLSKTNREVCVAYYMEGKSCSEIAAEKKISVEMVKYHLFKTRKLLKEGIGMTRQLGEKSYNPGVFRVNFWGSHNEYWELFQRKLPGSIVLSAYYTAMTAQELSLETGVPMAYLEDELEILLKAKVLKKEGERYRTNMVILTDVYEKEFISKTSHIYKPLAEKLFSEAKALLPLVRKLDFRGKEYDDNRLLFAILNIAFTQGWQKAKEDSPVGEMPPLPSGNGVGWVFGHDNDYANSHFIGVTMKTYNKAWNAWYSAENYRILEKNQRYDHYCFPEKSEALCDAILGKESAGEEWILSYLAGENIVFRDGRKLTPNFPVFQKEVFEELVALLEPIARQTADCMIQVSEKAAVSLAEHAPPALREQCDPIAKIHHRMDVAAFLLEALIEEGLLTLPAEKTPLCIWGVRETY